MKRSHSLDEHDKKRGCITHIDSDTNTATRTRGTATHINKVRKDGIHLKHHLRRGPSLASSAVEFMKSEWTSDELDLTKQLKPLQEFIGDNFKFVEEIFSVFSIHEIKTLAPDLLKDLSINQLKELCLEEINSISAEKIKYILEGNKPEDFDKLITDETITKKNNSNKRSNSNSVDKCDDIQLSVDDNEYSDFLGAENIETKVLTKDVEVQANESSLESSSESEGIVSDDNNPGEGWMNMFAKTQMEILELEMRARAIRSLMKAQEDEDIQPDDDSKQISSTVENLKEAEKIESELNVCQHITDNETDKTIASIDSEIKETNSEADESDNNEDNNSDESEQRDNDMKQTDEISVNVSGNEFEENENSIDSNDMTGAQNVDNEKNCIHLCSTSELTKEDTIGDCEQQSNDELTCDLNS